MKRYIIFDEDCSICNQLARAIEKTADGKLNAININDVEASNLLDQVYPGGWEYIPYFVTVKHGQVNAWTGFGAAFQLSKLIGIKKTWRIWRLACQKGVILPPTSKSVSTFSTRRQFVKAGLAVLTTIVASKVPIAHACIPCESCPATCYYRPCRCSVYCCCYQGLPNYAPCDRYDCYDNTTGEYCGSFCSNCGSCGAVCA